MTTETLLNEILARLCEIERKVDISNNPMARITASERAGLIGRAIKTGDKKKVKEVLRQINGR